MVSTTKERLRTTTGTAQEFTTTEIKITTMASGSMTDVLEEVEFICLMDER